jgi:hypothetical protein
MTSTLIKKASIILFVLASAISCKPKEQVVDFKGIWTGISKSGDTFQIEDCGYPGEKIEITPDSVHHRDVTEDLDFKIDHIRKENLATTIYPEKEESSFYKFTWVNQQKGIMKCEISLDGAPVVKYFVNQANLPHIKKALTA